MRITIPSKTNKFALLIGIITCIVTLPSKSWAQRTLFNVPQAEVVEDNKLLFQQQISVTDQVQSSTTFTYGLGGNWQVGLNLYNVTLHQPSGNHHLLELVSHQPEENPSLLINVQKSIHLTEWLDIGIGTQTGAGYMDNPSKLKLANFSYINNQLSIGPVLKLNAGGYYTTPAYAGEGTNVGYMAALQVPIVQDKITFQAEYISGTNQYSNFITGFGFKLGKKWQLAVGAQIPSPGSQNTYGATLQLSTQ